ncbi:hypothetical protein BLA60_11600 [Actinophytocola xinjiangensis]|uniref:Winged helix DNA-binding domain-containing protein n=2 Tax=Actinophytocola xinjiangensis TaxID=485602 RepID=A0A7Z0WP08_9PSEU|nr:hypothetical protein BLA60_11600 [Actinophytocola xinjiangensis]
MRKTLHSLPLPLAAAAHAATLHFRERDALRSIANHGMSARTVTRVTTAIIDLVEQCGPLNHRAMEARLTDSRTDTVSVRLALKLAWERGVLTYLNRTNCWNREHRRFGLTGRLHPGLDMAMDRHRATTELVIEYFDRYGPASLRDAAWWSGLSRSAITAAMNESARDFVMVHTSWCESPMYMYRDRLEEFRSDSAEQRSSGISFLAHEDVALKAYFESRRRYLGDLPPRTAFNQIGEVLPTVIIDGQLAGTWKWDTGKKAVGWSLVSSCRSTVLRREIRHRAHTLTEALRLGWGTGDRKKVTTAQQEVTPTSSSR